VLHLIEKIRTYYKFALFVRALMPAGSRGRIMLLGDACHPTAPYLAKDESL
jgi:salicylate hydroxylase